MRSAWLRTLSPPFCREHDDEAIDLDQQIEQLQAALKRLQKDEL